MSKRLTSRSRKKLAGPLTQYLSFKSPPHGQSNAFQTRYSQAVIIRMLGDKADRIKQFPLSPSIGRLIDLYQKEITKFLDEVNSRLDKCNDRYRKRLEDVIKTARAQYAATEPKV
jgi:hypothetical protein